MTNSNQPKVNNLEQAIASCANVADDMVDEVKRGVHPSATKIALRSLEYHLVTCKLAYENLADEHIGRRVMFQAINKLQSAIDHLKGHDWGVFAK